jgi:heme/copper-type cytochrome/quinol oxidase subunit 2
MPTPSRRSEAGRSYIFGENDVLVNDLHIPVHEEIVLAIKSQDVLHSFFLPNLRVKQDVVPGMKQFVWFLPNKTGVYDIVCAELCGWGHYKRRGRLTVEPREKFDVWLAERRRSRPVGVSAQGAGTAVSSRGSSSGSVSHGGGRG